MKRILIIGGCGYLGSAIFNQLVDWCELVDVPPRLNEYGHMTTAMTKYRVDTVDLEWFGNIVNMANIKEDYKNLTKEFIQGYDVVILLAAFSSPAMAVNSDYLCMGATSRENYKNFADLVAKLKTGQKFIYASTASLYNGIIEISTEDAPLQAPSNVYDEFKQQCDDLMEQYPDVEYYSLRLGTVSGPSAHTRVDTSINSMTLNAIDKHLVSVYNGEVRRAFTDIKDLVRAVQLIVDSSENKRGIYNVASFNATMNEVGFQVARTTGVGLELTTQEQIEAQLGKKLPKTYDFAIDATKFRRAFDFEFMGTVNSIVEDLGRDINHAIKTIRRDGVKYE